MSTEKRYTQIGILAPEAGPPNAMKIADPRSASDLTSKRLRKFVDPGTKAGVAQESIRRPTNIVPVKRESPQTSYSMCFSQKLSSDVTLSVENEPPYSCFLISQFPLDKAEEVLFWIRRAGSHRNIVSVLHAFATDDLLYISMEEMTVSLATIVKCPAYPDERQLRAIVGQVSGLSSGF
jgi:hypothetical protein